MTSGGTVEQLVILVQNGVLTPFCNLLDAKDFKTVMVVLDGLTNILNAADKMGQIESIAIMIEENGGLDKLEALQNHENEKVYQKAVAMIDAFFNEGVTNLFIVLFIFIYYSCSRGNLIIVICYRMMRTNRLYRKKMAINLISKHPKVHHRVVFNFD